jgi:hypothetical protein
MGVLLPLLMACDGHAENQKSVTVPVHPEKAHRQAEIGGTKFQLAFDDAFQGAGAGRHQGELRDLRFAEGDSYMMECLPERLSWENSTLSISLGSAKIEDNYSLITINPSNKITVIAATTDAAFVGANEIQPETIKSNIKINTNAQTTYGQMDDTAYPYPAFGRDGEYLIMLVDDALIFSKNGIGAKRGKAPRVMAGCAIHWAGLK